MTQWKTVTPSCDDGFHYRVFHLLDRSIGMHALREAFPDGEANHLNFVLFSTSGVHGTYCAIEDVVIGGEIDEVTFLIVHPRTVTLRYGNARPESSGDIEFLKKLRASSHAAIAEIGMQIRIDPAP